MSLSRGAVADSPRPGSLPSQDGEDAVRLAVRLAVRRWLQLAGSALLVGITIPALVLLLERGGTFCGAIRRLT